MKISRRMFPEPVGSGPAAACAPAPLVALPPASAHVPPSSGERMGEAPRMQSMPSSPDLPGCVSTGATRPECERNMREAIEFHLDGLREEGEAVPLVLVLHKATNGQIKAALEKIGALACVKKTPRMIRVENFA